MTETLNVRSTASEVLPFEIGKRFVFVRTNIKAIQENVGSEEEFIGFEYDEVQYEKDEYIRIMSETNAATEATLDALLTDIIPNLVGMGV